MNMVIHILKKDFRRLRIFLIFWLPIALISAIANVIRPTAENYALQAVQQLIVGLTSAFQFLMMALIIPFLMHSEPLAGTTAFWLTRPMKKSDVMKSKLLFAGLFFVVLPTVINILSLSASLVPAAYIAPMAVEYLIFYAGGLLLLMVMASLTRNFGQYALVGGIYMISAATIGGIIGFTQRINETFGFLNDATLTDSRNLLSNLAGILILSWILFIQYREHRIIRSYALLAFEFILTLVIALYSPWEFYSSPAGQLTEIQKEAISISIDKDKEPYARDTISLGKETKKEIWGNLLFEDLPEASFARENKIDALFESAGIITKENLHAYPLDASYTHIESLQAAIEPFDLIPHINRSHYPTELLIISTPDYLATRHDVGIYRADILFDIYRYEQLATLPLEVGAENLTERSRIGIAAVLAEAEGCTVNIREQYINPLFSRNREPKPGSRFQYLLINPETREAFLPDRNPANARPEDFSSFYVTSKLLHFSSSNKATYSIDEQWLKNAELLIVESVWLGETAQFIEDLAFRMDKAGERPEVIPGTTAKNNINKLTGITLPDNPSRDDVRSYIEQIYAVSATQERFSSRDPQINMLLKIPPEHLDLLIQQIFDAEPNYYERRAIRILPTPAQKELVLRYLYQIPVLAKAVNTHGWQEGTRETLLAGLREKETLPADWLIAVTLLDDPSVYPLLADFFARGKYYQPKTYGVIKDLPGIDLDDAVDQAWKTAQIGSTSQRCDMIPIALAHGHQNALAAAVMSLSKNNISGDRKTSFRKSIQKHIGVTGTDEELRNWFEANRDSLHFNKQTRLYSGDHTLPETVQIILQDTDARIEGDLRHFEKIGAIGHWRNPNDQIRYTIPQLETGKYSILAVYAAPKEYGGRVSIQLNQFNLEKEFTPTGGWKSQDIALAGQFSHTGGPVDITLSTLRQNTASGSVFNLYSLIIRKNQALENGGSDHD